MNIKKVTNSQLSTIESKKERKTNQENKQIRNRTIGMEAIWSVVSWEGEEGE